MVCVERVNLANLTGERAAHSTADLGTIVPGSLWREMQLRIQALRHICIPSLALRLGACLCEASLW